MAFKPIEILIKARDEASGAFERLREKISAIGQIGIGVALGNAFTELASQAANVARAFVRMNADLQDARGALRAIFGDVQVAEQQIDVLRATADAAGVSFADMMGPYRSFAANMQAANVPLQVQNDLLRSVAQATTTLGLSSKELGGALDALGRMAARGTVNMSDLERRLGRSLPGAMKMAADGLGITQQQLQELVKAGGLAARDLFPALSASLRDMASENDTLAAGWDRLKNAINRAMTAVGDGGGLQVLAAGTKALAAAMGALVVPLQAATELLLGFGKTIGAAVAAVTILADGSLSASQKMEALRSIGSDVSDVFADAGGRIRDTAGAFYDAATGADETTRAMGALGAAASGASAGAQSLASTWVATSVAMLEAAAAADRAAQNAGKHAQAVKLEGEALVETAKARSDANEIAEAEATAAERNADALQKVASARAEQLEILQAELTAKQNLIAGSEAEQQARQSEIDALQKKVDALTVESEATQRAADKAADEASARRSTALATRDQSAELEKLAKVRAEAIERERDAKVALDEGRISQAEYNQVAREATAAIKAHNDALADAVDKQNAIKTARVAEAQATLSLLESQRELAGQSAEIARLMGDESAARRYRIQQLELDIKITRAKAEVQRAEAEGSIAVARAQMEELRVKGQLTELKKAELNASIKLAEAKMKEADATAAGAKVTQQAINNLRDYGEEAMRAGDRGKSAGEKAAEGWDEAAAAAERAEKAAKKYDDYMANRFERGWAKNEDGNVVSAKEDDALRNQRIAALFGEDMVGNANAEAAYALKKRIDMLVRYSDLTKGDGSLALLRNELDRLTRAVEDDRRTRAQQGGSESTSAPVPAPTSAPAGTGGTVVNLHYNGASIGPVPTDETGRRTLEKMLGELSRARGVAS